MEVRKLTNKENSYLLEKKIIMEFISKRNQVYLLENNNELEVIKIFSSKEDYLKEKNCYELLQEAKKVTTNPYCKFPKILKSCDQEVYIIFQYIQGNTLLDVFEECERKGDFNKCLKIMRNLLKWVTAFQQMLSKKEYVEKLFLKNQIDKKNLSISDDNIISIWDVNFKNFIIRDEVIYGLDFENVNTGKVTDDYAKILAYMLVYNPIASNFKLSLYQELLEEIVIISGLKKEEINQLIKNELKIIEKRRGINYGDIC